MKELKTLSDYIKKRKDGSLYIPVGYIRAYLKKLERYLGPWQEKKMKELMGDLYERA